MQLKAKNSAQFIFWSTLTITLIIKLYLAYIVPITGDEAEYVYWGQHLAWGYYDHPPMVGWLLYPFALIGSSNIWLRLPQILLSTLIGYLIYRGLRGYDVKKAYLIATLYLLTIVSVFDVIILTDTFLMLFAFLAVYCLFLALRDDKYLYYILTGFFIGAAFLSKYLMFPVALGIFIVFIVTQNIQRKWFKFSLLVIFALPFFIQNIVWNYQHDWVNLLFNIDLRNVGNSHFNLYTLLLYLLTLLLLYSPIILYYGASEFKKIWQLKTNSIVSVFIITTFTTIIFYGLLSLVKRIGLHWIFCVYPFFFMVLFSVLDVKKIKKCIVFMGVYSAIFLLIIVVSFNLPLSFWQSKPTLSPKLNWFLNYHEVEAQIQPYINKGFILTTPSYAQSYLLAYKQKWSAADWGIGSVHGRQDDLSSDFKIFAGKNIVIVDINKKLKLPEVKPYFTKTIFKKAYLHGMPFHIILGYDFNYKAYRDAILQGIYRKYYQSPLLKYLPRAREYYGEKYFRT
jgi:4-amino-4-deoxy-L-arabinose transferase-like glycosyltransferase